MLTTKNRHIVYPPRTIQPAPARPAHCATIDAAIIAGTPTAEIISSLGATNDAVQQRKRRLRKQGKLACLNVLK